MRADRRCCRFSRALPPWRTASRSRVEHQPEPPMRALREPHTRAPEARPRSLGFGERRGTSGMALATSWLTSGRSTVRAIAPSRKEKPVRMTHRGKNCRRHALSTLASLVALLPLVPAAAAPDTDTQAGLWTGMTQTVRSRSTKLLSAGYTARGEYWFRVDKAGSVTGYAVVAFEPTADLSGLNARVDAAKDIAGTLLGAIGSLLGPAEVGLMGPELSVS